MDLQHDQLYHIYNRGNNRQQVFFEDGHYLLFLRKLRELLQPQAQTLAWCLMPNHFHLLVQLRATSTAQLFNTAICTVLSSYTRAVNRARNRTGSLFQQGTKAKLLDSEAYALQCFCYIHQNPQRAGLETVGSAWPWSSFRDYAGRRTGTLCDRELAAALLDLPPAGPELEALMRQVLPPSTRTALY